MVQMMVPTGSGLNCYGETISASYTLSMAKVCIIQKAWEI